MTSEPLAGRLRLLRQRGWTAPVTQEHLGRLLGVSAPTISSWEKPDSAATPTPERLLAYATLFGVPRSAEAVRLLPDEELTEPERAARDALLAELTALRQHAAGPTTVENLDPWRFADGAPIRIIVGKQTEPPRTARGSRWNYMALSAFADLDALVELYGHLREHNPGTDVQYGLARRLEGEDLHAHLVLLGGLAWEQSELRLLLPMPVRQVADPEVEGGDPFEEVATGRRWLPTITEDRVVEDVGLLARAASPLDSDRTLTVLSGIFTRGVYGAVRCLTDPGLRLANARYLHGRFPGDSFGMLMRVLGTEHAIGTPKLTDPRVRLAEFAI